MLKTIGSTNQSTWVGVSEGLIGNACEMGYTSQSLYSSEPKAASLLPLAHNAQDFEATESVRIVALRADDMKITGII